MSNYNKLMTAEEAEAYIAERMNGKVKKAIEVLKDKAAYDERIRVQRQGEYNGWTNYESWRVNLELVADLDPDYFGTPDTIGDLADAIESYVDDVLTESGSSSVVLDYACAFVRNVDWYEIAKNFASDNDELKYDSDGNLIDEEEEDDE